MRNKALIERATLSGSLNTNQVHIALFFAHNEYLNYYEMPLIQGNFQVRNIPYLPDIEWHLPYSIHPIADSQIESDYLLARSEKEVIDKYVDICSSLPEWELLDILEKEGCIFSKLRNNADTLNKKEYYDSTGTYILIPNIRHINTFFLD